MPKGDDQNRRAELLARVEQDRVFPRFRLTDEQWRKIAELSGIPEAAEEARDYIETTIGIFRESEASELNLVTAGEIRDLAERAQNLYDRLTKLIEVPSAYTALISEFEGQRRLSQVLDVLVGLPKWLLVAAERRVEADKPGPKAENVYWLVGNLDGIREQFTGEKITRSGKYDSSRKYITYVCKIADPEIGNGTIDRAMKSRIKQSK
jgi:hypothetical protein